MERVVKLETEVADSKAMVALLLEAVQALTDQVADLESKVCHCQCVDRCSCRPIEVEASSPSPPTTSWGEEAVILDNRIVPALY